MTEEEAKAKWCPFAREDGGAGHGAANRDYAGKTMTPCIASLCMAWRNTTRHFIPADGSMDQTHPYSDGWRIIRSVNPEGPQPELEIELAHTGYCGLAGEP